MKKMLLLSLLCQMFLWELPAQNTYPATAAHMEFLGKSRSLREIEASRTLDRTRTAKSKLRQEVPKEIPNFTGFVPMPTPFADVALPQNGDPLARAHAGRTPGLDIEPLIVVEGLDRPTSGGVTPPDPCGDASPDYFLQLANASGGTYLKVFDMEGANVFSLSSLNFLWSEFNATGLGDPIALYDQAAGQWLISEFQDFGGNALLIAISENSDPTGSWYAYRVQTPSFPDYPKYSIWPNAYLVTTNESDDNNIAIYALDRQAMLSGADNPSVQRLGIPKFNASNAWQTAQPVDWDGYNTPPADAPGYIVRMYDDAWQGGQDKVEVWEVHIDWADEDNSFTSGPTDIITAPFESDLCTGSFTNCIPQPNGNKVDALQQIILHRVPYINFSSHESITLHFAVDVDGSDRAGLRWMELRKTGNAPWSLYQEGTYAPGDGNSRFAGGISMDRSGNILMAYTAGGPNKALSLRFTGRLANDPLGEMTINEYEFATGLSSQNSSRWGDYATMSINPANGTDFWFTGEYMGNNGAWRTKVMMARIRRDTNDIGPQALVQPQSSGYLTDAEPIKVAVRNYGYAAQHDIGISYSLNGGPAINEVITDTIPADSIYYHTFATTEDLSVIGPYDFVVYTSLLSDTAYFNDTLRTRVLQLPRNDVALQGFEGLETAICDSIAIVSIIIRNTGVDTLTSALLTYQLNAEPEDTINWTGSLAPGQQEYIVLTLGPLVAGDQLFSATVSLPNGLPDENTSNDFRETNFTVILGGGEVTLRLLTDSWPEETSWELKDGAGNVLYSGGPYDQETTLIEEEWCLADTCYTFTIFDSYGDGLSGPPAGDVQIINKDGIIVADLNVINFGSSHDLDFCTTFICMLGINADIRHESAPGAGDGRVILSIDNGITPYQYSINGGQSFQSSPVFPNLDAGSYQVVVRDGRNCTADTTVIVESCTLEIAAEVTNATGENEADGTITVSQSGGEGPYTYTLQGQTAQDSSIFSSLLPGSYTVIVRDESSGCEASLDVVVDITVDAEEPVFFGRQVRLFPNPTEGFVRVEIRGLQSSGFLPVKIYDASGQAIRHARLVTYSGVAQGVISLYGLPAGAYYFRFEHEELPELYPVVLNGKGD
ncbi:MAG: T9SS type A sorting domain-containing protein [Phaeodactylibacter sp.]|nr:T9SS type A sorting domain-containing protein [Phaeodactylibacter sp.]MCB9274479.1 T9SS type A sorting domain-containing protein [Lewinellaceae bacterium]